MLCFVFILLWSQYVTHTWLNWGPEVISTEITPLPALSSVCGLLVCNWSWVERFALGILAQKEVEEDGMMSSSSPDFWPEFEFLLLEK